MRPLEPALQPRSNKVPTSPKPICRGRFAAGAKRYTGYGSIDKDLARSSYSLSMITLFVKPTAGGDKLSVEVEASVSVAELKAELGKLRPIPPRLSSA